MTNRSLLTAHVTRRGFLCGSAAAAVATSCTLPLLPLPPARRLFHAEGAADVQAALNAAGPVGGIVELPAGTFELQLQPHPDNAGYRTGLVIPGGVLLRGAGRSRTVLRVADGQPGQTECFAALAMNAGIGGSASGAQLADLTLDGNSSTQLGDQHGVAWIRSPGATCLRVEARDFKGTANAGPHETFAFEGELSTGLRYTDCVVSSGGASGFSVNACTDTSYVRCKSSGLLVSAAFTHNGCQTIVHRDCSASDSPYGFNSEVSANVRHEWSTASSCYNGYVVNGTNGWNAAPTCIAEDSTGSGVCIAGGARSWQYDGTYARNNNDLLVLG